MGGSRFAARFFINDVRIGETAALVDKGNGYTYRIRMDAHAVRVMEVYENYRRPANGVKAVYVLNWGLLRSVPRQKAVAA